MTEERKDYSQAEREELAKKGEALPDGSYPIANVADLKNAIQAIGRASNPSKAKAFIIKRAKALGATGELPEDWRSDVENLEHRETLAQRLSEGLVEHRSFGEISEIREEGGSLVFRGYASLTGVPYPVGPFEETISAGAFKRTLSEDPDVSLLINHDGLPIARTKAGTLRLNEDERGLRVDADLDTRDPDVQRVVAKMANGSLDGQMSFAFRCNDDVWSDDMSERTVRSLTLHRGDVSIVTHGASPSTYSEIAYRSMQGWLEAEQRAGKVFSEGNMAQLNNIMNRVQTADNNVDKALEEFSNLTNQPNTNAPSNSDADGDKMEQGHYAGRSEKLDAESRSLAFKLKYKRSL